MTMLFTDGFDQQDFATKYEYNSAGTLTTITTTRHGYGRCLQQPSNIALQVLFRKTVTASAKLIVGYAYYIATQADNGNVLSLNGDGNVTNHLNLRVLSTGALQLLRGSTAIATSAAGVFSLNAWHYIEVEATVADAGGICNVYVNGGAVITFTGDTRNGGTATTLDTVAWSYGATSQAPRFDDIYIFNGLGSTNNAVIGDCRVETIWPNAAGSATSLTPVGTANNYENVDESPTSAADYNWSATAGHQDLYNMGTIVAGAVQVYGVQVNVAAKKTDAGARSIKTLLRSGGTTAAGATTALATTTDVYSTVHETDPSTGVAFTVGSIPGIEAGAEVV